MTEKGSIPVIHLFSVDESLIDGAGGNYLLDAQLIPVIERMLELIGSDARDADTTENNLDESCAAGILCNITCNNKRYKEHIIAVGGTRILINQYISKPGKPSIAEPILCTLRLVFIKILLIQCNTLCISKI